MVYSFVLVLQLIYINMCYRMFSITVCVAWLVTSIFCAGCPPSRVAQKLGASGVRVPPHFADLNYRSIICSNGTVNTLNT